MSPSSKGAGQIPYRSSKLTLYLQPLLQDGSVRITSICCVKGRGFGEIKGQSHKGFWNREVVQENQVCLNQGHKLVDMEKRELRKHKTKKPVQEENKEEIEVTGNDREKMEATPEVERDQGSKHNVWRAVTKEDKARLRNRGRNKKDRQNKNRGSENTRDLPEDTQGDFLQPELEERLEEDQIFFKE